MSKTQIRTLLVDDEVLGRLALRQALASHEEVEIVGECSNADEALRAVEIVHPCLLFLDIQMPGMDGFKLLHGLSRDGWPLVVFATAYGEHALRAFDANAVDYILKPIDQARFDEAMERVKRRWETKTVRTADRLFKRATKSFVQRISVRVGDHLRLIAVADIDWVRADGNYVHINMGGSTFHHRGSLRHLLASLDPSRFIRIHRSIAVNVDRVREVHPLFQGAAEVVLQDGTRLELSRRFRAGVRSAFEVR
ncbi:MAG: LytTR family transcriptional regulator DNA-binding domain-containing protein [Steroidobacteraceae bacterium]